MHRFSDQTEDRSSGDSLVAPYLLAHSRPFPAKTLLQRLAGERRRGRHAAKPAHILAINDILTAVMQPFGVGDGDQTPIDVPAPLCAGTFDRCGAKRMSVETALAQLLRMIHRRALKLAALPDDERDLHYDLIRLSCCGAAELIGQSPDKAAVTANSMVEFTRAMVGIIETGLGSDAGPSDQWARSDSSTVWQPGRSQ